MSAWKIDADDPAWRNASEDKREALRAWMRAAGCDPEITRSVQLGEGYFVAKQDAEIVDLAYRQVTYPTNIPPPWWAFEAELRADAVQSILGLLVELGPAFEEDEDGAS